MILETLTLQGFRNLPDGMLSFDDHRTLIFGENGSGKTSVLEAIFLLGFGKSFLNARRREIVADGQEGFFVRGGLRGSFGSCSVSAAQGSQFLLHLNDRKCNLPDISEYLYPICFSSLQYNAHIESRQLLRRLVDRFIFGVQPLYLHYILRYNQALKQKNSLLRRAQPPLAQSEIESWDQILAEAGSRIVHERMTLVEKLNRVIRDKFSPELTLRYRPDTGTVAGDSFLAALRAARAREIRGRQSLVGAQRDAFEFHVGGRRLARFSAGEKKKFLLLFYFAYIESCRDSRRESPILLIDDFDAAVDDQNLDFLFSRYPGIQVIATSVRADRRFSRQIELHKEN